MKRTRMKATSLIALINLKYFLKRDKLILSYVLVIYDFGKNISWSIKKKFIFCLRVIGGWGTLTLEDYLEKVMQLIGIKKYWFFFFTIFIFSLTISLVFISIFSLKEIFLRNSSRSN